MVRPKKYPGQAVSPLSSEITAAMRQMGSRSRFIHPEIWARWFHIAGEQMYKRTFPHMFKGTTLTIGVASSAWLQELNLLKPRLLDRLDEEVGKGVVTDIKMVLNTSIGKGRPKEWAPEEVIHKTPDTSKLSKELSEAADSIEDKELAEAVKKAAAVYQDK